MDILNYTLFGGLISFYILKNLCRIFKKEIKINDTLFNYSRKIHYSTFLLIISSILLNFFDLRFRGEWTNETIMWIFLITNFIIQFRTEKLKTKIEKIYFKIIFFSPITLVISWIIPMLGLVVCYNFTLLFNNYQDSIYKDNKIKFCYEEKLFNYHYEFEVYELKNIFEKKIKTISRDEVNFEKINNVKFLNKNQIKVEYTEFDSETKNEIIINLKE